MAQEVAAVAPLLPADAPLPPVPDSSAPDWSDATRIRLYLQDLAVKVSTGKVPVSVAEALRKLADSALRVVDVETDLLLAQQLAGDDE